MIGSGSAFAKVTFLCHPHMEEQPRFMVLSEAESTNDYAMNMIRQGLATPGMAVFTDHQTRGKGQRGKTWQSEQGKNMALSILLHPAGCFPIDKFYFNAFLTISCLDFLKGFVPDGFSVKWPNDLYWQDRKVGGILIENVVRGNAWQWAVAGIGININQQDFSSLENKATSLYLIAGSEQELPDIAWKLHRHIHAAMTQIPNFDSILKRFNGELFMKGKEATLQSGETIGNYTIQNVDEEGRLHVIDSNGKNKAFRVGEVVWKK